MATYTAAKIITLLGQQLHDVGQDVWTEAVILPYISEAQSLLASLRPDATAIVESFTLTQTAKQEIPSNGVRFLNCTMNLGAGGAVPGRHVRRISRDEIDGYYPNWTSDTSAVEVKKFIFEIETPRFFWVYPTPSVANLAVQLSYSSAPTEVTTTGATIGIDDIYIAHLIEWVLYRCLSMPSKGANPTIADGHKNTFYTMLGLKAQVDDVIAKATS